MSGLNAEISAFLNSLSEDERHGALSAYGEGDIGELAFNIEMGEDELSASGVDYHHVDLTKESAVEKAREMTLSAHEKVFCSATIPSSTNRTGGHAVALVIDNDNKTVLYHDPYGLPPPPDIQSVLTESFESYSIQASSLGQQQDTTSCALITAMNLAAYAGGDKPDPEIHDKLWGIRVRHAPAIIEHLKQKVATSEDRVAVSPDAVAGNDGFKVVSEGPSQAGRIIDTFNSLNTEDRDLRPAWRLFIVLAKQIEGIHSEAHCEMP